MFKLRTPLYLSARRAWLRALSVDRWTDAETSVSFALPLFSLFLYNNIYCNIMFLKSKYNEISTVSSIYKIVNSNV